MKKWELDIQKERVSDEYWIDTEGIIRAWKWTLREADDYNSLHYGIAHKHFPEIEHPDDYVYNLGWITVGSAYGRTIKGEPTQAQINTLDRLGRKKIRDSYGVLYEW